MSAASSVTHSDPPLPPLGKGGNDCRCAPADFPSGVDSKFPNRILAVAFLLAIALPMFGVMRDGVEEQLAENERRKPAEFPEVETRTRGWITYPRKRSLRAFPRKFEQWFNDHIPTRPALLTTYNSARYVGLVSENFGRPTAGGQNRAGVVIGRNGWLFYRGERMVDYYRGTNPFTEDELDAWVRTLRARRDWCKARGIRYVFVFTPNKHSIYPEHMPRSLTRVRDKSRLDVLLERLQGEDGIDVIDLRPALLRAKQERLTYYKTDTHWNEFGAYVGYRVIMRKLRTWYPEFRAKPLNEFDIEERDFPDGDLAKMLRSPFPYDDTEIRLIPKKTTVGSNVQTVSHQQIEPGSASPRQVRFAHGEATRPSAVILHDSFMGNLHPFLTPHWRKVDYTTGRSLPEDLIERVRPTIVIQELVERKLSDMPHAVAGPQGVAVKQTK